MSSSSAFHMLFLQHCGQAMEFLISDLCVAAFYLHYLPVMWLLYPVAPSPAAFYLDRRRLLGAGVHPSRVVHSVSLDAHQ